MSEGDAVPGCDDGESGSGCTPNGGSPGARAAYAGSDAGAENLRENGHTSWEVCPLPRYVIRLSTGRFSRGK